jgi:riboflavin synthase
MFTGIVEELGRFLGRDGPRFRFGATTVLDDVALGDSIAVNGCCLTVVAFDDTSWTADVSDETVDRTTLATLEAGDPVNFERAVRADQRMGGHVVQGHIDGVASIIAPVPDLHVRLPHELMAYCVEKGSIALDGVSLTIFGLDDDDDSFHVAVIPHTSEVTTLGSRPAGATVNVEVDVMAKYVARLVEAYRAASPP